MPDTKTHYVNPANLLWAKFTECGMRSATRSTTGEVAAITCPECARRVAATTARKAAK